MMARRAVQLAAAHVPTMAALCVGNTLTERAINNSTNMIKKALLLLMAGASLTIAATVMQAGEDHHVRWHQNFDNSVLLDDDLYGQRLVLPEDYHTARKIAGRHYAEVNANSVIGISVSYDVAPTRILSDEELDSWARANATTWWQFELLTIVYRSLEKTAVTHATEDPERAQAILDRKRAEEHTPEPSPALVEDLARHNINYHTKAAAYNGATSWYFEVKDPTHSGANFEFLVPVGSSEKTIMETAYEQCFSVPFTNSNVLVGGKHIITPAAAKRLSLVRW
jgi:hypothetical protein